MNQLNLAELVAKVLYNSSNPTDPFDNDAGWWIAVSVKNIIQLVDDRTFADVIWKRLQFRGSNEAVDP